MILQKEVVLQKYEYVDHPFDHHVLKRQRQLILLNQNQQYKRIFYPHLQVFEVLQRLQNFHLYIS
ncbi:hypothetical protein SAL_1595 [Streptococcus agalactiae 515]|nr:hypothetical protein SAL_1595 [Streptococcus agalactiae 515]